MICKSLYTKTLLMAFGIMVAFLLQQYLINLNFFHISEVGRLAFEDGDACKALEKSLIASPYEEYAALRIGYSYANGRCVQQNISEATRWLLIFEDGNEKAIARHFFLASVELYQIEGDANTPQLRSKMLVLLRESQKRGYVLGGQDFRWSPHFKEYLREIGWMFDEK